MTLFYYRDEVRRVDSPPTERLRVLASQLFYTKGTDGIPVERQKLLVRPLWATSPGLSNGQSFDVLNVDVILVARAADLL